MKIQKLYINCDVLAILILLAVTPLGFIPIGPINATTMHIPVIIASIVLGPRLGAFLGGTFGLISMIRSTVIQTPLSLSFSVYPSHRNRTWKLESLADRVYSSHLDWGGSLFRL